MRRMITNSEGAYPNEACGLLWGKRCDADVHVVNVHQSENIAREPETQFEINPQLRFDLERLARESDMGVVGLYHSHPNGSAEPSKVDLSRAWETDLIWLIIALEDGRAVDQRAYKVKIPKERFVEIDIRVIISQ